MSAAVDTAQRPKGGRVARAAAMLCADEAFQRWLDRRRAHAGAEHDAQRARDWLVGACGVQSRAELDHNADAALMFRRIVIAFQRDNPSRAPVGVPKRKPLLLPKLLAAASGAPCMRCGRADGTVVAAHYQGPRSHGYGKGVGQKPDDSYVAFLCASCHALLDSYRNGDQELVRSEEFLHLVALTINWCLRNDVLAEV